MNRSLGEEGHVFPIGYPISSSSPFPAAETEYASHFGYEQAVKSVYAANPKDLALFTDLTHEWDHSTLFDKLARLSSPPCPVQPAYDGMHLVRQAPDDPWSLSS